jgi:hypothetical protein
MTDQQAQQSKKPDLVAQIIDYENGGMTEEETISFFQELVNSGLAWQLQGSYGRMAAYLIEKGLVKRKV